MKNEKTVEVNEVSENRYYVDALSELEQMLSDVCDMADSLRQCGIKVEAMRDTLRTLPRYNALAERAVGLDSTVLEYMGRRDADPKLRKKYNLIVSRCGKRAKSVGLD